MVVVDGGRQLLEPGEGGDGIERLIFLCELRVHGRYMHN
jgi:hypothetical protein